MTDLFSINDYIHDAILVLIEGHEQCNSDTLSLRVNGSSLMYESSIDNSRNLLNCMQTLNYTGITVRNTSMQYFE